MKATILLILGHSQCIEGDGSLFGRREARLTCSIDDTRHFQPPGEDQVLLSRPARRSQVAPGRRP
jgi:hypothetical protein